MTEKKRQKNIITEKKHPPASEDAVGIAAVKRNRLNFVVGNDNETRSHRVRLRNDPQVGDGRLRFKDFDFFDDDRSDFADGIVRLGINGANHFAFVGSDDEYVVGFPIRRPHLRIDNQFSEFIPRREKRKEKNKNQLFSMLLSIQITTL
jgi:hypothetical protein